jgi:hypothetical protein
MDVSKFVGWLSVTLSLGACEIHVDSTAPASAPALPPAVYAPSPTPGPPQRRVLPLHIARVPGIRGEEVVVPSYAPGSPIVFAQPDAQFPSRVFLKRHVPQGSPPPPSETIWQLVPQATRIPNLHGRFGAGTMLPGVAFEAPQLPRGVYDAWYFDGRPTAPLRPVEAPVKTADARASQSITFEIKPRLRVPEAVVHAAAGTDVDITVGFAGPAWIPASTIAATQPYGGVPIALTGLGGSMQPASGQATQALTGPDGFARFRVHVSSVGQVDLRAVSPGYDPVIARVVTFDASRVAGGRLVLRTDLLQPGDALLYFRNGIVSDTIAWAEPQEIGANPNGRPPPLYAPYGAYSHAGIYVGKNPQGVDEVIEMLEGKWDGWTRRPLEASVKDETLLVDVYRRPGLTPTQRQQLAANAISYHAEHTFSGYHLPYANGQIIVLAKAFTAWFDTPVRLLADYEDLFDEGKDRMICSELVAWSYYDAGLGLRVRPWQDVAGHGLLTTLDRSMDYTTPNMLAQSPDLQFQFMLWPMHG